MSLTPRPDWAGKSKYIQITSFVGKCPKCGFEVLIKEDKWNKPQTIAHINCDYCKDLVEFTRVKSITET